MTLTAYNSIRARLSPPARPVRVQREPRSERARRMAERRQQQAADDRARRVREWWQPVPLALRTPYDAPHDPAGDAALEAGFREGRLLYRMGIVKSVRQALEALRNGRFRRIPNTPPEISWWFQRREWTSQELRGRLPFVGVLNHARSRPVWVSAVTVAVTVPSQPTLRELELLGAWEGAQAEAKERELRQRIERHPEQWGDIVLTSGRRIGRAILAADAALRGEAASEVVAVDGVKAGAG